MSDAELIAAVESVLIPAEAEANAEAEAEEVTVAATEDEPAAESGPVDILVVDEIVVEDIVVVVPEPAPAAPVLGGENIVEFRERIAAVQAQFSVAATEALGQAELVVTDAIAALNQALLNGVVGLGSWRENDQASVAELHAALDRYSEYLNRVLAL